MGTDDGWDTAGGRDTLLAFHLTGRSSGHLEGLDGTRPLPALFARYRDLSALRYDFPVVLVDDDEVDDPIEVIRPLSAIMDDVLSGMTHDANVDRAAQMAFRLEQAIRAGMDSAVAPLLSDALADAARRLATSAEPHVGDDLDRIRAAVDVDGRLADCDRTLPVRLVRHVWETVQRRKARAFAADIGRLARQLSDILRADDAWSEGGRRPDALRRSIGGPFVAAFDFDTLSQVLTASRPAVTLSAERRARIEKVLGILETQRFFPPLTPDAGDSGSPEPFDFEFASCGDTLSAYQARLPDARSLEQAIAIGELEAAGEYRDRHAALFGGALDPGDPVLADVSRLPDYLVCLDGTRLSAGEQDRLEEILRLGLPMKILWQTDDLVEESSLDGGSIGVAWRGRQLVSLAIGMGDVYVLQASASHLIRARERLVDGLRHRGPSLFSVYSGAASSADGIPCYLRAAAAMESRVFPALSFDPSAGPDWAARLSLADNPQPERDWPVHRLEYRDALGQREELDVPVTVLDFLVADDRAARHFAIVPGGSWGAGLADLADAIAGPDPSGRPHVPYVPIVDAADVLRQAAVDERLVHEVRRGLAHWRSLQELAGLRPSRVADAAASRPPAVEEAPVVGEVASPEVISAPAVGGNGAVSAHNAAEVLSEAPSTPVAVGPAGPAPAPEPSPDEPYIDTPRCTTCNECTQINNRMFAYNEDRQAYIADPAAGSYRQLVDAAESCQVSIIHPGRPRDPNEPGLDELLERAQPFL